MQYRQTYRPTDRQTEEEDVGDGPQRDAAAGESDEEKRAAKRATAARLRQAAKEKAKRAAEGQKLVVQLEAKKAERLKKAEEQHQHALEEEAEAEAARQQLERARAVAKYPLPRGGLLGPQPWPSAVGSVARAPPFPGREAPHGRR